MIARFAPFKDHTMILSSKKATNYGRSGSNQSGHVDSYLRKSFGVRRGF
jgi:hypothetical protein